MVNPPGAAHPSGIARVAVRLRKDQAMTTIRICVAACIVAAGGGLAAAQDTVGIPAVDQPAEPAAPTKDPAAALADIQRALNQADDVPSAAVSVNIHADTVVLSGEVQSQLQAARALALAQQEAGGVRVSSHVEVRSTVEERDARASSLAVVSEVEDALRQDRRTADLGIAVSVDDEQVIGLHGLVPSRESRAAAEEVAARVDGVERVNSTLMVPGE